MSGEAPSRAAEFVIAEMHPIDDDFDIKPNGDARSISCTVKKTGSGSNTSGFSVPARHTEAEVKSFADQDVDIVREYFQAPHGTGCAAERNMRRWLPGRAGGMRMMRIAERLGIYDRSKLNMDAEVQ